MGLRIASLSLEGFKSFAAKVELVFPGDIVAIVGPNGAGKSNVCDAIAWVLGEQSARLLRSQTMGDVIFAGSAQRPPAGAAQVTLVLQPRDGSPDHRLEITRRILRDGTSEYRLGGKRVRLKDIADRLAEVGIGTRAYAIIEQGRILQVLSAKPADRRALFEEAAGISHFRARRQEAELKLAETRGNLERVADIVAEVRRQLRAVRRQARVAQRHRELQADVAKLGATIAALRLSQVQAAMERAQQELAEARKRKAATAAALARAEAEVAQLQRLWEEKAYELQELQAQHGKLLATTQRLAAEEEACRRELASLREREAHASRALGEVEAQLTEEKAQEQELAAKLALASKECQAAARAAQQAQAAAKALAAQAQQAEEAAEKARAELLRLVAAAAEARNRLHRLQVEQEQIGYQSTRLATETQRLAAHLAALAQEEAQAAESEQALREQLLAAQAALRQVEERLERTRAALAREQSQRDELEHALWQVRHEKEAVQRARSQLRALPEGLRRLLPDELLAGTVADYLDPPEGLAKLLDDAYGELLTLPVVEGEEAVARLLQGPHPGGTVEVAIRDRTLPPLENPTLAGAGVATEELGWLSRLLPPVVHPASSAEAASFAQDPQLLVLLGEKAVRQGQRLRLGDGRKAVLGALQLKQKEHELAARELELQGARDAVAAAAAQLASTKQQLEGELAAWQKKVRQATEALAEASSRREAKHRERVRLERELAALRAEAARLEAELARNQQELAQAEEQAKLLEERAAGGSAAVDEASAKAASARAAASEAAGAAERAEAAHLLGKERLLHLERELARHRKLEDQLAAQKTRITQELAALQQGQREQARRLAALREELERELAASSRCEASMVQAQEAAAARKAAMEQKQQQAAALRQEDEQAQQAVHQQELVLAELAAQRAHLLEGLGEPPAGELPPLEALPELLAQQEELLGKLAALGPVNELAVEQEQELSQRFAFLAAQKQDLERSLESLQQSLRELDATCKERFLATLEEANRHFSQVFRELFGGGEAQVALADPESPLESGVEVRVRPPGKHTQSVLLLSGGEKALAALALLLALFRIRPAPFCVLDEVDAPLDDVNVERLCQHLRAQAEQTQFLLITHNRRTMAHADVLYGVTMEEPGVSRVVSVRLEDP